MDNKAKIYVLLDEHNRVRYVGCTSLSLQVRLTAHIYKKHGNSYRSMWIRDMLSRGYRPRIQLVDIVDERDADDEERGWIKYFKDYGHELTNETKGGKRPSAWYLAEKRGCHKL